MNQQLNNELLKKYLRRKKIALIADIILLIFFLGIGVYIWENIEYIKIMAGDPCRICEDKTGGQCVKFSLTNIAVDSDKYFNETEAKGLIPTTPK